MEHWICGGSWLAIRPTHYCSIKPHDHGLVSGLLPQQEWPHPVFSEAVCWEFKEAETHSPCLKDRELPWWPGIAKLWSLVVYLHVANKNAEHRHRQVANRWWTSASGLGRHSVGSLPRQSWQKPHPTLHSAHIISYNIFLFLPPKPNTHTHTHTHRHTHTYRQTKYNNPRCVCARGLISHLETLPYCFDHALTQWVKSWSVCMYVCGHCCLLLSPFLFYNPSTVNVINRHFWNVKIMCGLWDN